ncbi:MAG: ABC transporter substrate-binding protein, partial [Pseudomonadota bacterium]|nr:ABC transporter substrate-binding protein [Pseudomonadota bacterium]
MAKHFSGISKNRRRVLQSAAAIGGAAALGFPMISRAQDKPIKVGMGTILSGRVAQLGASSRNAVMMEVEKFNAAGGLGGRKIEMVIRDSKGQPQESARIARELVTSDGCEILFDCESSAGAFAVHEVARDLGVLCIHNLSETTSLSADPKLRIPNAFRTARQGVHDSIVGGAYAATIAKAKGLKRWVTCSPDYAYGRDATGDFVEFLKHFNPEVEIVAEAWPKLFQADYTEVITKILHAKPQAMYSCLWGGDLTSFIDQASIYALFSQMQFFAVNMADYTALMAVKNLPPGIHSGNRYLRTFPKSKANMEWGNAYFAKHKEYPTNWSWEAASGMQFLTQAMKQTNSTDTRKLSEALRGMKINSPFGADGTMTMRAEDQTVVGYA